MRYGVRGRERCRNCGMTSRWRRPSVSPTFIRNGEARTRTIRRSEARRRGVTRVRQSSTSGTNRERLRRSSTVHRELPLSGRFSTTPRHHESFARDTRSRFGRTPRSPPALRARAPMLDLADLEGAPGVAGRPAIRRNGPCRVAACRARTRSFVVEAPRRIDLLILRPSCGPRLLRSICGLTFEDGRDAARRPSGVSALQNGSYWSRSARRRRWQDGGGIRVVPDRRKSLLDLGRSSSEHWSGGSGGTAGLVPDAWSGHDHAAHDRCAGTRVVRASA